MRRDSAPFVYFIRRADGDGPVKIGCSQTPEQRLMSLTVWSPYPLAIVAAVAGDETLEHRFHAMFADSHSHREWFLPSAALDETIELLSTGDFDLDCLPPPRTLSQRVWQPWSETTKAQVRVTNGLRRLRNAKVLIPREYDGLPWQNDRSDDDHLAILKRALAFITLHESGSRCRRGA